MLSNLTNLVLRTLLGGLLLTGGSLLAQRVPTPAGSATVSAPAASAWSLPSCKFVTSLCVDQQGNLWTGTEDEGIWCSPADGSKPLQYMPKEGLGDEHCYALACDTQGRIWAGHQSHGVSVFVPEQGRWANYDVLAGPIGERVFDIAVNPVDGDVWIATSAGVTRYSSAGNAWSYLTRAEGLPSDLVQSIAIDRRGVIYLGTQADGLAIGRPPYRKWAAVRGTDHLTMHPEGVGLPSNRINDVLVSADGAVWVATTSGLAVSRDQGNSFKFIRGADWVEKVRNRMGGSPPNWKPQSGETLSEDYVTCLAQDADGSVVIGHRQKGYELWDGQRYIAVDPRSEAVGRHVLPGDGYVSAALGVPGGGYLLGTYGAGSCLGRGVFEPAATTKAKGKRSASVSPSAARAAVKSGYPSPAAVPTSQWLDQAAEMLCKIPPKGPARQSTVIPLNDDWRTKGDWLGRVGRYWSCTGATLGANDYVWGGAPEAVPCFAQVGPNHREGDQLRRWIHWEFTDQRRCLELTNAYLHSRVAKKLTTWEVNRRESEWDDHGETYPMSAEGPDVCFGLKVPKGTFVLSLYDVNPNGHDGVNRYRDYRLAIQQHDSRRLISVFPEAGENELATGRIRDFWGGVYKRYLVNGPADLTLRVERAHSFNTILVGVMLDSLEEYPVPYYHNIPSWKALSEQRDRQRSAAGKVATSAEVVKAMEQSGPADAGADASATRLLAALDRLRLCNPEAWAIRARPYYLQCARYLLSRPEAKSQMATCAYRLGFYEAWEQRQKAMGQLTSREIEKSIRWDEKSFTYSGSGYDRISCRAAELRNPWLTMGK